MSMRAPAPVQEAMRLVISEPDRAETICREVLSRDPSDLDARVVLIESLRRQGRLSEARAEAEPFASANPRSFGAQRGLGLVLADCGDSKAAATALRTAASLAPSHPYVWRELGDALRAAGDTAASQDAYLQHARMAAPDPRVAQASAALNDNDATRAKAALEVFLQAYPSDVTALGLLAQAHARLGDAAKAETALRQALELAPGYGYARQALAQLMIGLGRYEDALQEAEALHAVNPTNNGAKTLLASVLAALGEFDRAIALYREVVVSDPKHVGAWVHLGHALKTVGRAAEGASAYRRAIEIAPQAGEAYWSLANLKTSSFGTADIAKIEAQLRRTNLPLSDRVYMLYALGRAHEQAGGAALAFANYSEGAKLYRAGVSYDAAQFTDSVERSRRILTREFFEARKGGGNPARDPIFIVGLPRAGSTLVEQILASHSMVESTMELGDIVALARSVAGGGEYVSALPGLGVGAFAPLGARYLEATRIHRKLDRPHFIDKMPNNFAHTGFVHLILPNAKIIDVRRHPLACGWSCFKQHWAMGQLFTYDLRELGLYYRDYVRLMEHYDDVLPGRVHRVIYEDLVGNPEEEIRKLIAYCELPFEDAVLRPHESDRAVRTPSAEQVRQPISDKSMNDWKPYEPYLQPLKNALGNVLTAYPDPPP
jgi:tetratricopeptide (TPR) repeat protein